MKTAKIISLVAFISNACLAVYSVFQYLEVRSTFKALDISVFPYPLIFSLVFSIGSIIYYFYLKSKEKQGKNIKSALLVSFVLLIVPILTIILVSAFTYTNSLYEQLGVIPEDEEQIEDEYADWNTYRNEEFGIEFKYPKGWVLSASKEKESLIILENQNNVSQRIEFLKSSGPPPEIMDMEIVGTEDVMVDDLYTKREFFRHKIEYKYHLRVFIVEENLFYYTDFDENNLNELPIIYDKILSTIKFID